MKRCLFATLALTAAAIQVSAQFRIEKHDATNVDVDGNVVFSGTEAGGVSIDDIAAIYRTPQPTLTGFTVGFEGCELGSADNNSVTGSESVYREHGIRFVNKELASLHSGVIVSRKSEVSNWESAYPGSCSATAVITTDKTKPAGADGSEKFAVFYLCPTVATDTDYLPEFKFSGGEAHAIKSAKVNNIADIWQKCKIGFYTSPGFTDGDYFDIIFTGYDADGNTTGSVTVPMADFRDGKSVIINEWTSVDLSPLGTVSRVALTYDASQAYHDFDRSLGTFGVCVDNITFD